MLLAADFYLDIFSSPPTPARVFSAMSLQPAPLSTADAVNPLINKLNPDGLKPCCACPDTKKLRDDCFLQFGSNVDEDGDSALKCKDIVANHLKCMRGYGFNV